VPGRAGWRAVAATRVRRRRLSHDPDGILLAAGPRGHHGRLYRAADPFRPYRPGHHNFTEDFIFDPFQEPGIPQEQLDELAAAGVRAIYATTDGTFEIFDEAGWGDPCLWCEGFDGDHDGFCTGEPTFDCDDANPGIWSTPGEARDLGFDDAVTLVWSEPAEPGGVACAYDLLRSGDAGDFLGAGTCVESDDAQDLSALDPQEPGSGGAFFYLARASNGCPQGEGPLGQGSDGAPRPGRPCP
jgi:hypothetical protein